MEKAADACKQLIDEAEKKGKGLYIVNNKENGKVDPFMSCYGATMRTEGEGNNEIIWFRPKGNYGDWEQHGTPRGCGGNGGLGGYSITGRCFLYGRRNGTYTGI
mgnify:CR=1 FL=1